MRKLLHSTLILMALQLGISVQAAPGGGVALMQGEEVMFVNGARVRCDADCQVQIFDDGSMQVEFTQGAAGPGLQLQASMQPVRLTLQDGNQWLTYELVEGRSAYFAHGREQGSTKATLLRSMTREERLEMDNQKRALAEYKSVTRRHLSRTPIGRRVLDVEVSPLQDGLPSQE